MGLFGGSASRVNQIEQKIEYLPRWRAELLAKAMMGETKGRRVQVQIPPFQLQELATPEAGKRRR